MAYTVFTPGTVVTSQFCNNVARPRITTNPDRDGDMPPVGDDQLDQGASSLLARANEYLGAFRTSTGTGLAATVGAGTVILADGSPVTNPITQVSLPANAVSFIWVDPTGAIAHSTVRPSDGSVMLARATTDAAQITQLDDLRPRFKIGSNQQSPPALVGQIIFTLFAPSTSVLFTDESGWQWVNLSIDNAVSISNAAGGADVASDEIRSLFVRLWASPGIQLRSATASISKDSSADVDWANGRRLVIPNPAGVAMIGAGGIFSTGAEVGSPTHTNTIEEMASHDHPAVARPHAHTYDRTDEVSPGGIAGFFEEGDEEGLHRQQNTGSTTVVVDINRTGGGKPYSLYQPSLACTMLMFTGVQV